MAKQDTRIKILKAAEELFSNNGYDGVPTRMIADKAGITEMTLFNHFPSKELIYKTVVKESYLAIEIESVLSELRYNDLEKDLKIISRKLIDYFIKNRNFLMMKLKEKQSFQNDERFSIEKDPLLRQITPVFEAYGNKGVIKGSSKRNALFFLSSIKGLCHLCLLENKGEEDIKVLIEDFAGIFRRGIICA